MAFTDDFVLARRDDPKLDYAPNRRDWRQARTQEPASCWRQGLVLGHLDRLTEAMIIPEEKGRRGMTFGEFDARIRNDKEFKDNLEPAIDLMLNFNFMDRPVLARILLAQAVIHRLLLYTYTCDTNINGLKLALALKRFVNSTEFDQDLVWWPADTVSPVPTIVSYVQERLEWLSPDDYTIA